MYAVAGPHVVHEMIDGEVILIDFTTGSYYSVTGAAATTWTLLCEGTAIDEIAEALSGGEESLPDGTDSEVVDFAERLVAEGLLRRAGESPGSTPPDGAKTGDERLAFTPLEFERFTDMQDLILLDPVHDVSKEGWPTPRTQEASP